MGDCCRTMMRAPDFRRGRFLVVGVFGRSLGTAETMKYLTPPSSFLSLKCCGFLGNSSWVAPEAAAHLSRMNRGFEERHVLIPAFVSLALKHGSLG
jgi:hypothetical protein